MLKLSILDQSPISAGKSPREALQSSIRLAQLGEELGYERYWIAEHHDLFGLACPNPDVMLGVIGAHTNTIRIGAGAVLLPYYKPFRVAETYNLLQTLYPGRIDLGLGRAPGGSAEVSLALSDNYLKQVNEYPNQIDELLQFLHQCFPKDHPYGKISAAPVPEESPETWLLGTSEKSGILAAEKEINYAFGHFMSDSDGPDIVKTYRESYEVGNVIVAITVICAETTEKAEELALSNLIWKIQQEKMVENHVLPSIEEAKKYTLTKKEEEKIVKMKQKMIIGDPAKVKNEILTLNELYKVDEVMIITITHEEEAKFTSYHLLAEEFNR